MSQTHEKHGFQVKRRTIVFAGSVLIASATPLGQAFWRMGGIRGLQDSAGYLTEAEQSSPTGRIELFLGNHRMPEPYGDAGKTVWDPYINNGDLSVSLWRNYERKMIAERMREAHAAGKPYIIAVDGQTPQMQAQPQTESVISLPMLPLPIDYALGKPEGMPDSFYVVAAEPMGRFGLQAKSLFPDDAKIGQEIEAIGDEIYARYDPYTKANSNRGGTASNAQVATDHTFLEVESATIIAGMATQMTRSKVSLKQGTVGLAAVAAAEAIDLASNTIAENGDNGTLGVNIGYDTSQQAQRVDTVVANATGEDDQTPLSLWVVARTILGYEKAQAILEHPYLYDKPTGVIGVSGNPVPAGSVDLLYGTYHNVDAPEIIEDKTFRKQTVQAFLTDLLTTAKTAIEARKTSSDANIANRFSDASMMFYLLNAVASSLIEGRITKVTIPWGQSTIDPNRDPHAKLDFQKVVAFENAHAQVTQYIYSMNVGQWVNEGLEAFLIAQHIPYDPRFFHPVQNAAQPEATPTPTPARQTPRTYSRRSLFGLRS